VTESREFGAYFPLALRLEEKYKIDISCSDYYDVYAKYKISGKHHMTKAETALVESKNSLIRHYLARFNRKTKRYSKAIDMIANSILMLFNKELLMSIVS
jgi:insertion element IS1 protein InsB